MARGEDFSQEGLDRGWFTIFILMDFPMHVVRISMEYKSLDKHNF